MTADGMIYYINNADRRLAARIKYLNYNYNNMCHYQRRNLILNRVRPN